MSSHISIRPPSASDEALFLAAARRSQASHRPWTRAPATPVEFRAYMERMQQPENCAHMVCYGDTESIAGVINVTNIVMGSFRSGYLGYYVFAGHERQGFMRAGLLATVRHAFKVLKLHRLEANIQPANTASIALVASCGFLKEGYSPRYLKIAGRWRDHERWAITAKQ